MNFRREPIPERAEERIQVRRFRIGRVVVFQHLLEEWLNERDLHECRRRCATSRDCRGKAVGTRLLAACDWSDELRTPTVARPRQCAERSSCAVAVLLEQLP